MFSKLVYLFLGGTFVAFVVTAQARLARVSSRRSAAASAREEIKKKREEAHAADREGWIAHLKALGYTCFAIAILYLIMLLLVEANAATILPAIPKATPPF